MRISRVGYALGWSLLFVVGALSAGCPPPAASTAPTLSAFQVNSGAATASSRTVLLGSTVTGGPTQYIASETSGFAGATWKTYSSSVSFQLSSGDGVKTVYFQVKNGVGSSGVLSDTITLHETEETILLPGGVPLVMVWVPGASYLMGRVNSEQDSFDSEAPQHSVAVTGFWTAKYELTKRQWQAVMGTTPWNGFGYISTNLDSPAVYVSWDDAKAFVTALNSWTSKTFRLPTEAEWEFACRGGTTTRFYWGDDATYLAGDPYAWWVYTAWDVNQAYAHVAGLLLPNALGLYDMSGNAAEWCEDDWHATYTGAPTNGSAWVDQSPNISKSVRGGSWYSAGNDCRSASRNHYDKTVTSNLIGFRIARS